MARARKLTADAYVVNTLRFHGGMSQAEAEAAGRAPEEARREAEEL
jgi:hypothetical protein